MGLRRPFIIRRVQGSSMLPSLKPGRIVVGWCYSLALKPGQLIIFTHQGREMIKRIQNIEADEFFVVGDNPSASTDSRSFGRVSRQQIMARVLGVGR
jgi:nickel-type superoxide dismutase maturation protease